jgi:regulator of replication initiation timing
MDIMELKVKHAEEVIVLYKEIIELKKDIEYLKNKYEPLEKENETLKIHNETLVEQLCTDDHRIYQSKDGKVLNDIFGDFCKLHIEEKPSKYGPLKLGFVTDLFKQWHSNEYSTLAPRPKSFRDYMEQKYGDYSEGGWTNISIKDEFI